MKLAYVVLNMILAVYLYPSWVIVWDELFALINFPEPTGFTARFIGLGVYLLIVGAFVSPLYFFMRGRKNDSIDNRGDGL